MYDDLQTVFCRCQVWIQYEPKLLELFSKIVHNSKSEKLRSLCKALEELLKFFSEISHTENYDFW